MSGRVEQSGPAALPIADAQAVSGPAEAEAEADAEALRHTQLAFVFALSLTGGADEARDIAQEAMLRLLGHAAALRDRTDVRPWLLTTVRNLVRDRWRRARRRPSDSIDAAPVIHALRAPGPDPEQAFARRQAQERIWRALSGLPADKREILVLRDFHDLSYAAIAAVLGIPAGTVMSRLHAARAALRAGLQRSRGHA